MRSLIPSHLPPWLLNAEDSQHTSVEFIKQVVVTLEVSILSKHLILDHFGLMVPPGPPNKHPRYPHARTLFLSRTRSDDGRSKVDFEEGYARAARFEFCVSLSFLPNLM